MLHGLKTIICKNNYFLRPTVTNILETHGYNLKKNLDTNPENDAKQKRVHVLTLPYFYIRTL